jgi:hypothetical protein
MSDELRYPVHRIGEVRRACEDVPLKPGDPRWYDLAPLRHAQTLVGLKAIFSDDPGSDRFHHRVLCGHRGTGKSTELLHFADWANASGYACYRIEVDSFYGMVELEFSDFFLMAALVAEEALEAAQAPLPPSALNSIREWFADITKEKHETKQSNIEITGTVQAGGGIPGIGKLVTALVSGIKMGSEDAIRVRENVRKYPEQLIDLVTNLLAEANKRLREAGRARGLVLIFDNLDRYEPARIANALMAGDLVKKLAAHAVITIPIHLEYNPPRGPIRDAFGPSIVLPMISLRPKAEPWNSTALSSKYDDTAVECMVDALRNRVSVESLFEAPEDAATLAKMSGGCMRDLMHLVTQARTESSSDKLDRQAVKRAVVELRNTYKRTLSDRSYARLAQIVARSEVPRDELTLELLYMRAVLEYNDAEGNVWIDVHPVVIDLPEIQDALRKLSNR